MAGKEFRFSVDILREYSVAALRNADELLQEGALLYESGRVARAYFLAVASIEETGKGLLAFDAQGRNLNDSAVTAKLRRVMEDHSHKITTAFIPILLPHTNDTDFLTKVMNWTIQLKRGREPSMYTDIRYDTCEIDVPSVLVRNVAARDSLRLARECLNSVQKYIAEEKPKTRSRAEDHVFSMKLDHLTKLANTEDFWWYYINELQSGRGDFMVAVADYQQKFVLKGKKYKGNDEIEKPQISQEQSPRPPQ